MRAPSLSALLAKALDRLRALSLALPPSLEMASVAIYRVDQAGNRRYLGSGCCYRDPKLFLTAHHCIAATATEELRVAVSPYSQASEDALVQRVVQHPSADLAALMTAAGLSGTSPLDSVDSVILGGEEVSAHGFPLESEGAISEPTAKHYSGVIHRLLDYSDGAYSYEALELSFGAPEGLSGSAVALPFRDRGLVAHDLVGIVTKDRESARTLRTVTDVIDGDLRFQERIDGVALHAIAVDLTALQDWLATLKP